MRSGRAGGKFRSYTTNSYTTIRYTTGGLDVADSDILRGLTTVNYLAALRTRRYSQSCHIRKSWVLLCNGASHREATASLPWMLQIHRGTVAT